MKLADITCLLSPTLYAIILGLVVNDASVKYDNARKYIEKESNAELGGDSSCR
jgi:hypothetical protein